MSADILDLLADPQRAAEIPSEYVAVMLRRLGFSRRRVGGRARYLVRAEKLEELACGYHIPSQTA